MPVIGNYGLAMYYARGGRGWLDRAAAIMYDFYSRYDSKRYKDAKFYVDIYGSKRDGLRYYFDTYMRSAAGNYWWLRRNIIAAGLKASKKVFNSKWWGAWKAR